MFDEGVVSPNEGHGVTPHTVCERPRVVSSSTRAVRAMEHSLPPRLPPSFMRKVPAEEAVGEEGPHVRRGRRLAKRRTWRHSPHYM